MMVKVTDIEQLQRQDHDTLIEVKTMVGNLSTDVKIMGDGINARLIDHEARIRKIEETIISTQPEKNIIRINGIDERMRKIEDLIISVNPDEKIKLLHDVDGRVSGMEKTQLVQRSIGGAIGGILVFILTQAPGWVRFIWKGF